MAHYQDTIWCDGCGVEILWAPLVAGTRDYCCLDCRDGLVCQCGERMELEARRRASMHGPAVTDLGQSDLTFRQS